MKWLVAFIVVAIVTVVVFAGRCIPKSEKTLPVTLLSQETEKWCWAASGEMIMQYMGASLQQCDEANKRFGRTDCCNTRPSDCVNGGWPEFDKYGFTSSHTSNAALSWDQIKRQIYCKGKPFAFSWKDAPFIGGGHMMVATGYTTFDGINWVYVNNPEPWGVGSTELIPYETYVSGPLYTHWDDYYDVTKN